MFWVRPARPRDYLSIIRLLKKSGQYDADLDSREYFLETLDSDYQFAFVATEQGRIVGAITKSAYFSGYAYIGRLAVDPDYRRRGIADSLVSSVEECVANAGGIRVHTFARKSNIASRKLLEKHNYRNLKNRFIYDKDFRKTKTEIV